MAMDCPCAKFGDFSCSRFGFIVMTDRQTHRITHTDAATLYSRDCRRREQQCAVLVFQLRLKLF